MKIQYGGRCFQFSGNPLQAYLIVKERIAFETVHDDPERVYLASRFVGQSVASHRRLSQVLFGQSNSV
jgi:hypothetical protein